MPVTKRKDYVIPREIPQDTFAKLGAAIMTNPLVARSSVRDAVAARRVGNSTEGMTVAHLAALSHEGAEELEKHPELLELKSNTGITVGDVAKKTLRREMALSRRA